MFRLCNPPCWELRRSMAVLASYSSNTSDSWYDYGRTGTEQKIGQPFTVGINADAVTSISFLTFIDHGTSVPDQAACGLYSNLAGVPGTLLEQGSNVTVTAVGNTSTTSYTSTFLGTTILLTGVTYWVVLTRTGTLGDPAYGATLDNVSIPYSQSLQWNGTTWSSANGAGFNINFTVNGAVAATSVSPLTILGAG